LGAGYADERLQDNLVERGPEVARWFAERAGGRWKIIKNFPDYHYPRAPGTVAAGRYLEVELFPGADLGPWQKKTFLSPHMPNGLTHDELFAWGGFPKVLSWDFALMGKRVRQDLRGFGPGMMAYFIKAALLDRRIPVKLSAPARALVADDGAATGVRLDDTTLRARKGVVLATGGSHPP